MNMKHFLLTTLMMLIMGISAYGQTNLTGRVYYNANIMKVQFDDELKKLEKDIAAKKAEAIAEAEKKRGRKLTAAETAKLNSEIDKGMKQAKSVMNGMKTAITLEFKSATEVVMKMDMNINDDAMKAALAIGPSSQKDTYVVKGNQVIVGTGKDQDTMTLSADGKTITGTMDGKKFTLTRTK